jgi:hypothetical protein
MFAFGVAILAVSVVPAEADCGLFGKARARRAAAMSACGGQVATFQSYTVQSYGYAQPPGTYAARTMFVVPATPFSVAPCASGQCPIAPSKVMPPLPPAVPTSAVSPSDPYGFGTWLNAQRARYGLHSVVCDPTLVAWAAQNNLYQSSRGIGHYVMGIARRQNAAMGAYSTIGVMWMNSPAHRAAILDPSVTTYGLASSGPWWTLNLR